MKKVIKYTIRTLLIILASVLLLVLIALVAIQTPYVKRQIVIIAENQLNPLMNAELSIGELKGNYFTHLELTDILLKSENDTLAYIGDVRLRYKLRPLLNGEIVIKEVAINNPVIKLEQLPDSTWNLQYIMKPTEEKPDTTSSQPFAMQVLLDKFALTNGNISINAFDSIIPKQISDLNIRLSGKYAANEQSLDLTEFRFNTVQPDLELKNLLVQANVNNEMASINKLLLQTGLNKIEANGKYFFDGIHKSSIHLNTSPIQLDEFKAFLPKDLEMPMHPIINLNGDLENKKLVADLEVKETNQSIQLSLISNYLIDYFTDSIATNEPTYDLTLAINKIDLRDWLNDKSMEYVLSGNLSAKGEGLDPNTLKANLKGNFTDMLLMGKSVKRLNINADYAAGNVKGIIDGNGGFGSIYLKPDAKRILSKNPTYNIDLRTRKLDLSYLLGKEYASNINLNASVNGWSFDPKRIQAKTLIVMSPSKVMTFDIDTIHSQIDYIRENVAINSFFIQTLSTQVHANGNYNLAGNTDLNLEVQIDDASEIAALFEMDSIDTKLNLNAHLYGLPADLNADVKLNLDSTVFKEMTLNSLKLDAFANIKGDSVFVDANAVARRFSTGGENSFVIDSVVLHAVTDTKNIDLQLQAANADIQTELNTNVNIGEAIDIALSKLNLAYKGYEWEMPDDTAKINIAGNNYTIQNFKLQSGNKTDSLQTISLDGKFSMEGEEDLQFYLQNINLAKVTEVVAPDLNLNGLLTFEMNLTGNAQQPIVDGKLNLDGTRYENYRFNTFNGNFGYNENNLSAELNIVPQDSGILTVKAKIPAEIRLDSMTFAVMENKNAPVDISLLIEKLPLAIVNAFFPTDEIKGHLDSDIKITGTVDSPDINGGINLKDGKLNIKKYGIDYRTMIADINFDNKNVRVDTFNIRSRQGNMFAKGDAKFDSDFFEGKMNTSELKIWFDKFHPVDHKQYNMELSGNVNLNANKDSTLFSGDLTIPQAMVYIPAIMNLMGQSTAPNLATPLLVLEMEKEKVAHDSLVYRSQSDTTAVKKEKETSSLAFLDNLQGQINLKIPRNMWIKNDDMRFELAGDLRLLKHRNYFEIFGDVDVIRGQYNLLGKVFIIKSGTITFQGGEELNPRLNIEAIYSFRDTERVKHDLVLNVGGTLSELELKFMYEDEQIGEGDALSYILFGTNMESLGQSQQDAVSSSGIDAVSMAKTAAASLISSQLTKLMGNTLNVDYIEFKSSGSFDNASFVVGKYITNKMFVSYEQNIGKIEDKDIARYEMKMEYELFKFLFFQLTSSSISNGFDFIFKFDEKAK